MREISINDLPYYSRWPARLLGIEPFATEEKTVTKMLSEYDTDKYRACLEFVHAHHGASIGDVRWEERGLSLRQTVCFSQRSKLYSASAKEAFSRREEGMIKSLRPLMKDVDTVIELGAGYGYNLALLHKAFPKKTYLGGELSPNAVQLSRALLSIGVVAPFNFYDKQWDIFNKTKSKKILVLTCHSAEMLPEARLLIDRLEEHAHRIRAVVHFEPLYLEDTKPSLLELLRRRYIEINKYNRDLLSALSDDVRVTMGTCVYDMFGINPLFPESFIVWRFN